MKQLKKTFLYFGLQVREKGKALFGHRLHVNNESIVHIALVQNGQDPRAGFR